MPSVDETRSVLDEALKMEVLAQENCDELLKEFKLNGFEETVAHIRNDEIHHQQMVMKLLSFL